MIKLSRSDEIWHKKTIQNYVSLKALLQSIVSLHSCVISLLSISVV